MISLVAIIYIHLTVGIKQFISVISEYIVNNNLNGALKYILDDWHFGYFGWLTIPLPLWVVFIDIFVLTILLLVDKNFELPKSEVVALGWFFQFKLLLLLQSCTFYGHHRF